jgi:cytochrome c553
LAAFASVAALLFPSVALEVRNSFAGGDMVDMTGVQPWDLCGECHGLDGAGNRIKFPRLAGLDPSYLVGQIRDFRSGARKNDDGQMQETVHELAEKDIPRVANWFAKQKAPWPKPTIDAAPDLDRARQLAVSGAPGIRACLSCHSAASLGTLDKPFDAPRIAGQRDFYIAKELIDYRNGQRANDPEQVMQKIARRLTNSEIVRLSIYLCENPDLHDLVVP